jgi:hypothetical protein
VNRPPGPEGTTGLSGLPLVSSGSSVACSMNGGQYLNGCCG